MDALELSVIDPTIAVRARKACAGAGAINAKVVTAVEMFLGWVPAFAE
jgi:hypothetical protein